MSEDYLWDRSGEPDPEIQRLEDVLGRLRSKQPPPEWPVLSNVRTMPGRAWLSRIRRPGAIAAAVTLVVGASWLASRPIESGWTVARMEGAPTINAKIMRATGQLAVGQWLITDHASRAKIDVGEIGEVELEPDSRLRLVRARQTDHRLALARGTMRAMIWAPPRLFSVETPSAVAVDLGCSYTLHVDDSGATTLHVTMGWVGFEQNGRESWVPAGAECVTRNPGQPGTPYFVDASAAFRTALARYDFEHDESSLGAVLSEARARDALTLWHLLPKMQGPVQMHIYERMSELVPPPPGVTREGVLSGDKPMLDRWWDQLGLGDSSWWRIWKGPSPFDKK